jgi:hypothetical protein
MLSQDWLRARLYRFMVVPFTLTLFIAGLVQSGLAQSGTNPLFLFKNYFVTGDYVVAGWVEGAPDGSGFAPGTISIPDTLQPAQNGVPTTVPAGADIVAAYLYWSTVEGNQTTFAGQQAYFNGYSITAEVLGNPNAPTSWSSGGCSGSANGSKTMRTYRADVHPYLPVDTNPASPTFGALIASGSIPVRLADSGSNGNTQPSALGASLVIIYRQLNPPVPLNAIVLYDGAFAPSNAGQTISQAITGFYEPAISPVAKLTHIVANGKANKGEQVYLNSLSQPLPSLYGSQPPFPGIYGTWDNATWVLSNYGYVSTTDTAETTSIVPTPTNSGCVSWGTMIMSTTVLDTDGDGLLDVWEKNQGYYDVVRENDPPNGQNDPNSGQWVGLPGANPNVKDLFVEVDYLNNLNGSAGPFLHTHLPKQAALDAVGQAFANQHIQVHFDVGNVYQSPADPYIISNPAGTGGKAISEGLLLCTDSAVLCPYPNQPAVAWKGGLEFLQNINNNPVLGNFQPGRVHSYHYALFGHSLGAPESFWGTVAAPINTGFGSIQLPQLTSIGVTSATSNNTTVTLQALAGQLVSPGACSLANPPSVCTDANNGRISISGALRQTALNGTYAFTNAVSNTVNNVTTTTFTVTTAGVTPGTYTYTNEPQLGVAYLGPSSTSGHSDIGGGDSVISLGLWGVDDPSTCQADPTQPLSSGQVYCNNQVGTLNEQTGTLLHELGHSLTLTHGGTYYTDPNNPSLPSYDLNCKPNYLSTMNYLFQVRGFVDGGFDYSGQTLAPLNETSSPVNGVPALSESLGLGVDILTGLPAAHLTRWYSAPNVLDIQLQNTTGGRYATVHCDGSPLLPNEPPAVRVDGTVAAGGNFSSPLDWNNDLITPDTVNPPGEDLNHNGPVDSPFSGFNDWEVFEPSNSVAMQQMSARANAFGLSGGSGLKPIGGGLKPIGGGADDDGGGLKPIGGGLKPIGGGLKPIGGGVEQDEDTATSTADPPTGLICSNCVGSAENNQSVPLTWTQPAFGQIRAYDIRRAQGNFPTPYDVAANVNLFTDIATLSGAPPLTTFTDTTTTFTTYTYFVTETNLQGVHSGPSVPLVVTVAGGATSTGITASPASPVFGQQVTMTATVTGSSGTPTGNVTFTVDGVSGTPISLGSTGTAALQLSSLTVGSHSITASYSGGGGFSGSTSVPYSLTVGQATATVTLGNLSPTYNGTPESVTATTNPAGLTVSITYNGSSTAPTNVGSYAVVATINNSNYQGSASGTLTIAHAPASVTPNAATKVYGMADPTLTGTLTGFVSADGVTATYTRTSGGTVGTYTISATLSPTSVLGNYSITYNTAAFTITKATASVTPNAATKVYGTADPTLTGTLTGFVPADGVTATYTRTSGGTVGTYTISATLSPANVLGNYSITYNTASFTITKASSVTTIVSTPDPSVVGQVVAVSINVVAGIGTGVPTGTVTVNASTGEMCGPVTLASGAGSCSITFATAGSRTLTASYSGDGNFIGSTSAGVAQSVGDFSITATPSAQTISSGHQAIYTVTLAPVGSLTATVALSCTGAPANSTCKVSPSTASLQGSPVSSTVTLSASKNVDHGTFTLTISATLVGGSLTHSTTVQLTVK